MYIFHIALFDEIKKIRKRSCSDETHDKHDALRKAAAIEVLDMVNAQAKERFSFTNHLEISCLSIKQCLVFCT